METDANYTRLIRSLARSKPVLSEKEELVNGIMAGITLRHERPLRSKASPDNFLFIWTGNGWFRGLMAGAASLLIGLFIYQQVIMNRRITGLEKQLVATAQLPVLPGPDAEKLLILETLQALQSGNDSVTLSRADLLRLMELYAGSADPYLALEKGSSYSHLLKNLLREKKNTPAHKPEVKMTNL
ncbi:MAG: hypothetical protein ACOYXB_14765 [Bacteroidota bacterium]